MAAPKGAGVVTGRYPFRNGHAYKLDGQKVDGVTTIIKGGLPAPALTYWAAKSVAEYVVENIDEVNDIVNRRPDTAVYHLKEVPWQARDLAANRGTEVHLWAERIVKGVETDEEPPEELVGHIENLAQFLVDWKPTFERVENVVASRKHRYMGTFDFLGNIPGIGYVLGDWKTSRSGIYPETALQLAAYRHAEFLVADNGEEIPMPEVDAAVAIWVTENGYEVIPVDTDELMFRQFLYCKQVHEFAKGRAKTCVHEPMLRPTAEVAS